MAEELYRLERAGYCYGEAPALSDVSLSIAGGETVCVLGANGSGKSTLLKMLDALILPTSGHASFSGVPLREAGRMRSFRRRVGFVFHEPDVQLFCPTVLEEVSFGPAQLGLKGTEAEKRAEETLSMLGLSGLEERAPYTLSSGEKKKVAIASVLAVNPDVLLFDEPTSALDPRTQVWLVELLCELKRAGKTIVMATHDLSLAGDVSDRVVVLSEAHTIAGQGAPAAVLSDRKLLLEANLIHEHAHRHGEVVHSHGHAPFAVPLAPLAVNDDERD